METPTELPLAPEAETEEDVNDPARRFVKIGQTIYPEVTYIAALHTVGLEKITRVSAASKGPRAVLRGLRSLKDEKVAERVLHEALARVVKVEKQTFTPEHVASVRGFIVATFPAPPAPSAPEPPAPVDPTKT